MHNLEILQDTPQAALLCRLHSRITLMEITVSILHFIPMNDCSGKVHRAVLRWGKDVATRISTISVPGLKSV